MASQKPDTKLWCDFGDDPLTVRHDFAASTNRVGELPDREIVIVTFCTRCGTIKSVQQEEDPT